MTDIVGVASSQVLPHFFQQAYRGSITMLCATLVLIVGGLAQLAPDVTGGCVFVLNFEVEGSSGDSKGKRVPELWNMRLVRQ